MLALASSGMQRGMLPYQSEQHAWAAHPLLAEDDVGACKG